MLPIRDQSTKSYPQVQNLLGSLVGGKNKERNGSPPKNCMSEMRVGPYKSFIPPLFVFVVILKRD